MSVRFQVAPDGKVRVNGAMLPPNVYLDQWALSRFATDKAMGDRLAHELGRGGTLMFSMANLFDLAMATPEIQDAILDFLSRFDERWLPLESEPQRVLQRERTGAPLPCMEQPILMGMLPLIIPEPDRLGGSGPVRLSRYAGLVRTPEAKETIVKSIDRMHTGLLPLVEEARKKWREDPAFKKRMNRLGPYRDGERTERVYEQLIRSIYKRADRFDRNQLLDFLHAVVPLAFGTIVLLDRNWKEMARQLDLPAPRPLVYESRDLEEFLRVLAAAPRFAELA